MPESAIAGIQYTTGGSKPSCRGRSDCQGPDGLLYVLTDEKPGAVLRIEPAR